MATNMTKATVALPDDYIAYLKEQAARRGVSMADVLRQAISTDQYIVNLQSNGGSLSVEEVGKPPVKLAFIR